jgi:hypothetical protein
MENYNLSQNEHIDSPVFFAVSPTKLIVMSIFTFGLYELYWFYRNWKFLKEKKGLNISPLARTLFLIIFCYDLFNRIRSHAITKGIKTNFNPAGLTIIYIILSFSYLFPDPVWIIGYLTFIPLVIVQSTINKLNKTQFESFIDNSFNPLNILGIIVGGILWIIILFMPS